MGLPVDPSPNITGGPLVLREQVGQHIPKLSPNAGHSVESDAVATALIDTMCVFFANLNCRIDGGVAYSHP